MYRIETIIVGEGNTQQLSDLPDRDIFITDGSDSRNEQSVSGFFMEWSGWHNLSCFARTF